MRHCGIAVADDEKTE
nr:hypothetical protein [Escherichia coli]